MTLFVTVLVEGTFAQATQGRWSSKVGNPSANGNTAVPQRLLGATGDSTLLDSSASPRFDATQIFNHSKPDPREMRLFPSQEHPVCSVQNKSADNWLVYYCGHADDWTKQRERYQTVLVYAGEQQYKVHRRVVGPSWWALNLLAIGAGIADVEVTQWDIRRGLPGREGNPLMGKSRGQAYAMVGGMELLAVLTSAHRKRAMTMNDELGIQPGARWWNRMPWWSPYAGQITTHMIGVASGLSGR